jgi:DNA-binding NarL/FixJ family response regulator
MAEVAMSRPILVVDDDDGLRAELARLLEQEGYPVREAATGAEALAIARGELPQFAVIDVCLPDRSGYEICHILRSEFGEALPIMFISAARCESYDRVTGFLVGGDDYLVKPFATDEFLARVRRLIRRATWRTPRASATLTSRESEVLQLLAEGLGQGEIATRLYISPKTVATHIEHVLAKLRVKSRAQAVAAAYQQGLIHTPARVE